MKKTNRIKLALDAVMLLLLLLMYRKNVLGLTFHEIGGMAVCGLFIIHKLLNGKWILTVTGKLLSPKVAFRCKLNWLIDFLLLLCFVLILISGIHISKVVFTGQRGASVYKSMHYAVSALALVLLGVHLGLHYESILNRTPARKLPLAFRRATAIVMSVAILGFGVYQMTATDFLRWMGDLGTVVGETAPIPGDIADGPQLPDPADGEEGENALPAEAEEASGGQGRGNGQGNGNQARNGDTEADVSALGSVLLGFLSITLAFAVVTAWIDGAHRTYKRNKRLQCKLAS